MKIIKTLILIALVTMQGRKLIGQTDSVVIEKTTESIQKSDFKQKLTYKYLDNNFREEKSMLKIGISPFSSINLDAQKIFTGYIDGNISFEKKLNTSISFVFDNNITYSNQSSYSLISAYSWLYSCDFGIRYYYSMKKRIKNSKGKNNLHGNYFSIKVEEPVFYFYGKYQDADNVFPKSDPNPRVYTDWKFKPYISLSWGLQRRLGKWGYIDVGPYVKFRKEDFGFGTYLKIGLAL